MFAKYIFILTHTRKRFHEVVSFKLYTNLKTIIIRLALETTFENFYMKFPLFRTLKFSNEHAETNCFPFRNITFKRYDLSLRTTKQQKYTTSCDLRSSSDTNAPNMKQDNSVRQRPVRLAIPSVHFLKICK